MIPELRDHCYEERLKECCLTRGDQFGVCQILNGYENIDRTIFSSPKKDDRTRGHEVTLV